MLKKALFLHFSIILLFVGCASTSTVKRTESVTIVLKNGDKIEADVLDVWQNKIVFRAKDWKKAYEYGEVLNVERVEGIRIADGSILSVDEYNAYRKGSKLKTKKKETGKKETLTEAKEPETKWSGDIQYEELKKKPISEMTENEFEYFMMMKEKELEAQKKEESVEKPVTVDKSIEEEIEDTKTISKSSEETVGKPEIEQKEEVVSESEIYDQGIGMKYPRPPFSPLTSPPNVQIEEAVESIIEAGLAPSYLNYLNNKINLGEELNSTEKTILKLIKNNPKWQEKSEDLKYLNRTAQKALYRAYIYNPDELSTKLGLIFDQNLDMDFLELMEQLHRKFGENVDMGEYRLLLDVLGESGGLAMKEILTNYDAWQFVISQDKSLVTK
jgi:hypothetical protein